ncbi:NAD-dependent epimerase/dehydratase family protein [Herbaspirillum rubrisubalbicans]|uniref:NAD-dependent epimerase n=1 Tax=Herbaspirillum rubrisubalbicans TaxID=80842 RepID=A0AAD0U530_9BURK|nr:NAD-dependent epimerase/dehydratase family protein [Herbaspirillum rubrisubalbicans]AYR23383.1 NAD-dependent epimerase [Herbaspirillum rubrisubalbicans]
MSVAIVTGSAGLIGSETVRVLSEKGFQVVGIDNDMRAAFFGPQASIRDNLAALQKDVQSYVHHSLDIRNAEGLRDVFRRYGKTISLVVHTAAQPSHDWAAGDPFTDFSVNATGTLNLLEMTRNYCRDAVFIFCSTNKVYGDTPNVLPLEEQETRWELTADHPWYVHGIDESMSIDTSRHSLFGVSKCSADLLVQEYGRYFEMKTACFRGGCLTGPAHTGAQLHGFLSYLCRCAVQGTPYTIFGYEGKQVRDNIHANDLVSAFWHFFQAPRSGEVYNMGGGRQSNCSVIEAINLCEKLTGKPMTVRYDAQHRSGDHIWWISDTRRFSVHFPEWNRRYTLEDIMAENIDMMQQRLEKRG